MTPDWKHTSGREKETRKNTCKILYFGTFYLQQQAQRTTTVVVVAAAIFRSRPSVVYDVDLITYERGRIKRSLQNTDDLRLFLSLVLNGGGIA